MTMKLRLVHRCSFRSSEITNLATALKTTKLTLQPHDVVMLHSLGGDQLIFVWRSVTVPHRDGKSAHLRSVTRSERLRLDGGQWDPLLLVKYAERVGIKLDNAQLWRAAEKHLRRAKAVA